MADDPPALAPVVTSFAGSVGVYPAAGFGGGDLFVAGRSHLAGALRCGELAVAGDSALGALQCGALAAERLVAGGLLCAGACVLGAPGLPVYIQGSLHVAEEVVAGGAGLAAGPAAVEGPVPLGGALTVAAAAAGVGAVALVLAQTRAGDAAGAFLALRLAGARGAGLVVSLAADPAAPMQVSLAWTEAGFVFGLPGGADGEVLRARFFGL